MASNVIQVDYEKLDEIKRSFEQQAGQCREMLARLRQRADPLESGGWAGEGASAFFNEMSTRVFPSMGRLSDSLAEGTTVTTQVAQVFKEAEEGTKATSGLFPGGIEPIAAPNVRQIIAEGHGITTPGTDTGIPPGNFTPDQVRAFADLLIDAPEVAQEELFYAFGNPQTAEMLRQLAAWAACDNADPGAVQAYRTAVEMLMDTFDNVDKTLQRRFTAAIAGLKGPGAGAVKGEMALHVVGIMEEWVGVEPGSSRLGALEEGVRHLEELALGTDGEQMIQYLASYEDKSEKIRTMFGAILTYDKRAGNRVVGQLLGRYAYAVARETQAGDPELARLRAMNLGRVVANAELAMDDTWSDPYVGRSAVEKVEHGAGIVRFTLNAVDTASGGVSKPGTDLIRGGLNILESHEKGLASKEDKVRKKALQAARAQLRDDLKDTVYTAYESVLDPGQVRGGDPKFMQRINDYRSWVSAGRKWALENALGV
jgi:WXG100 family type VII secretion target